jgi:hypothetical protein
MQYARNGSHIKACIGLTPEKVAIQCLHLATLIYRQVLWAIEYTLSEIFIRL